MEKIRFNDFERGYTDAEKEMRYNPKFKLIKKLTESLHRKHI